MYYNKFLFCRNISTSILFLVLSSVSMIYGQEGFPMDKKRPVVSKMSILAKEFEKDHDRSQSQVLRLARELGLPLREELPSGGLSELQAIGQDGTPIYYATLSDKVGEMTRASALYGDGLLGLGISGQGMQVGVWDGGVARTTHQEYKGRVEVLDGATQVNPHATMVMGTLVSSGIKDRARGVAHGATALTGDWTRDKIEVAEAAAQGLLLSNHSYGIKTDRVPDWYFGAYIKISSDWDKIMYNAPYYLMVTASGNAQKSGDNGSPIHGSTPDGYDLILGFAASKNGLTVAAVDADVDSRGELQKATVTGYSSFGPMDDGRIKPDISSGGTNVYTTSSTGDKEYTTSSGTSMATPGVTGSMLLLQQYYGQLNNTFMKAATLKGLVLHTADDVQEAGPDYKMGWGVINTITAARTITNKEYSTIIAEEELSNGDTYSITVDANGKEALMASISWTDPASGQVNRGTLNDTTPALVNDLDIRITKNGETHYPWRLNAAMASSPATKGDNRVDPFEKIDLANASGTYTITITHKGELATGAQHFSLIVTGVAVTQCNVEVPSEIHIGAADESSLTLQWQEAPDTLFEVQYKEDGEEDWNTQYTYDNFFGFKTLQKETEYNFRLRAVCTESVASDYTEEHSFTYRGKETQLEDVTEYETLSATNEPSFTIYPNPAVEQLTLEGELSANAAYSILDTGGTTVRSGSAKEATINVSDLSSGLYILAVYDLGGTKSTKFYKD